MSLVELFVPTEVAHDTVHELGELGNVGSVGGPPVNDLVARMLAATKEEVETLWRHPNVRTLVKYRKLRLEESAAL